MCVLCQDSSWEKVKKQSLCFIKTCQCCFFFPFLSIIQRQAEHRHTKSQFVFHRGKCGGYRDIKCYRKLYEFLSKAGGHYSSDVSADLSLNTGVPVDWGAKQTEIQFIKSDKGPGEGPGSASLNCFQFIVFSIRRRFQMAPTAMRSKGCIHFLITLYIVHGLQLFCSHCDDYTPCKTSWLCPVTTSMFYSKQMNTPSPVLTNRDVTECRKSDILAPVSKIQLHNIFKKLTANYYRAFGSSRVGVVMFKLQTADLNFYLPVNHVMLSEPNRWSVGE